MVLGLFLNFDSLVVVIDGDGKLFLSLFLSDYVLVKKLLDLFGYWKRGTEFFFFTRITVVGNNIVTNINAFVADEHRRPGDQFSDVVLVFVAERTPKDLVVRAFLRHGQLRCLMTSSIIPYSLLWSADMM